MFLVVLSILDKWLIEKGCSDINHRLIQNVSKKNQSLKQYNTKLPHYQCNHITNLPIQYTIFKEQLNEITQIVV